MKHLLLALTTLLVLTHLYVSAQNKNMTLSDTAHANSLIKESSVLVSKSKAIEAIAKLDTAQTIFEMFVGEESKEVADIIHQKGNIHFNLGRSEDALLSFQRALNIRLNILRVNHPDVAKSYNNIGTTQRVQGNFKASLESFLKALSINSKIKNGQTLSTAISYSNLGNVSNDLGNYDDAISYFNKSLNIRIALNGNESFSLVGSYGGMGNSYFSKGDIYRAIEVTQKALNITLKNPNQDYLVSGYLSNLAVFEKDVGNFEKSLEYNFKTLEIRLKILPPDHNDIATSYTNLGQVYSEKKQFDSALIYFQKALPIQIKNFGINHLSVADVYSNLGLVYLEQKNFAKALDYNEKALNICLNIFGEKHKLTGEAYYNMATTYSKTNNFIAADSMFKKGFFASGYMNKNDFAKVTNLNGLITELNEYGKLRYLQYKKNLEQEYLSQAIKINNEAILAIDFQNKTINSELDKKRQRSLSNFVYENALVYRYDLKDNDSVSQSAFNIAEQSKALLLLNQMNESKALHFSGIPDSLLKKESNTRIAISGLQKKRQEILNSGSKDLDQDVLNISSVLIDLEQQYDSLKLLFETHYPDYYRLKYSASTATVKDIQNKMLSDNESLLEYFVGDSTIFIFEITKKDLKFKKINQSSIALETLVRNVRDGLATYHGNIIDSAYLAAPKKFTTSATQLYKILIEPIEKDLKQKVIIIPDGILGYIPFEALIREKDEKPYHFNAHKYFLDNHQVSYCYSANLLKEMQTISPKKEPSQFLIAMAPFSTTDTILSPEILMDIESKRDEIKPLPNSGQEVAIVSKIMNGTAYYGKDATVNKFNDLAPSARIIHLATHSKANSTLGNYSYLAFNDTAQKAFLFARDLYNISLNADMVVLSACETGIGEIQRGEGIISMARAFSYAGAKSIVTSLWEVSDEKTKILMTDFYKYIKRGLNKDEALWRAKRDFMKKTLSDPYYWASFIAIGNMNPIKK